MKYCLTMGYSKKEEIRVIFSVDMFNEGVDIAPLDMVMFLRPTESPIVFLQQLGRGLRISRGKQYLNVLDFIGNYEKAGRTHLLLGGGTGISGNRPGDDGAFGNRLCDGGDAEYPDDCIVDFDMRLIELFAEMERIQDNGVLPQAVCGGVRRENHDHKCEPTDRYPILLCRVVF